MTRYYFDLLDSGGITTDDEGMDLPSMQRVQEEAARSLADMAREAVVRLDGNETHMAIEVRDKGGPVMQVRFTFEIARLRAH
jgi:hypothetical protein